MTALTREMIRQYACPKCKAMPGEPCHYRKERDRKRGKVHLHRMQKAQRSWDHQADRQRKREERIKPKPQPKLDSGPQVIEPWSPTKKWYKMRVDKAADGSWNVLDEAGAVVANQSTNIQAWRALDRLSEEH